LIDQLKGIFNRRFWQAGLQVGVFRCSNEVFEDEMSDSSLETPSEWTLSASGGIDRKYSLHSCPSKDAGDCVVDVQSRDLPKSASYSVDRVVDEEEGWRTALANVMITQATVDVEADGVTHPADDGHRDDDLRRINSTGFLGDARKEEECPSPASSMGGTYTVSALLVKKLLQKPNLIFYQKKFFLKCEGIVYFTFLLIRLIDCPGGAD
jgi:hypothetical protein